MSQQEVQSHENQLPPHLESRLSWALLLLRLGVLLVFFMWTFDKFLNPDHAALVWEKYDGFSVDGRTRS